jgi:ABC-type uncharacterized transport system substrate-binding protein
MEFKTNYEPLQINYDNQKGIGLFPVEYKLDPIFSRSVDSQYICKREDFYDKIANRELVSQIGTNPYHNTSYLEDIENSDKYLKPVSTTIMNNE